MLKCEQCIHLKENLPVGWVCEAHKTVIRNGFALKSSGKNCDKFSKK